MCLSVKNSAVGGGAAAADIVRFEQEANLHRNNLCLLVHRYLILSTCRMVLP